MDGLGPRHPVFRRSPLRRKAAQRTVRWSRRGFLDRACGGGVIGQTMPGGCLPRGTGKAWQACDPCLVYRLIHHDTPNTSLIPWQYPNINLVIPWYAVPVGDEYPHPRARNAETGGPWALVVLLQCSSLVRAVRAMFKGKDLQATSCQKQTSTFSRHVSFQPHLQAQAQAPHPMPMLDRSKAERMGLDGPCAE